MILVDTSAWIEYARATESPVDLRLTEIIRAGAVVATTEPVNMELLAGARSRAEEAQVRRMLLASFLLSFDPIADFDGASRVYRLCRAAGVTPSGLIDCMITTIAMRHGAAILANDVDFARIASVVALDLDPATPTEG